jgi:hypothetical protein
MRHTEPVTVAEHAVRVGDISLNVADVGSGPPVLLLHGFPDSWRLWRHQMMTGSARYVDAPWRYERLDGVGHWIPTHAPERLNTLLVDFLA